MSGLSGAKQACQADQGKKSGDGMRMGLALAGGLLLTASVTQGAEITVLSGNGAKAV
jgi:hypothetical protein